MKSKLFQRLADLPGINWFNRKEKMEYTEEIKEIKPMKGDESYTKLYQACLKYFSHIQALKKYINTMHGLVGQLDGWIEALDEHYVKQEKENELSIVALKNEIKKREQRIAELEKKLQVKSPISHHDIVLLLEKMDELKDSDAYKTRMKNKRNFGRMHNYFHNFLQKMGDKYNGENLTQ